MGDDWEISATTIYCRVCGATWSKMSMNKDRRPWSIDNSQLPIVRILFPKWLRERGGIIVYENHNFDSSAFGDRSYTPAMVIFAGETEPRPAPNRLGDVPSRFQYRVDHVTLEEFDGDVETALCTCFSPANEEEFKIKWRIEY